MNSKLEPVEALPVPPKYKPTFMDKLNSDKYFQWVFLIPLILVLIIFMFYPLFYAIYYSLHDYEIVNAATFIGFDNYRQVMFDSDFWSAMGRTGIILVSCIVLELVIGMAVAILFNRNFRGQNTIRGLCLLPLLISPLAMSMIWNFMLQYDYGIVN